ncbi:hypothetical protein pclt_cds_670 [Pandoravirus celtis]|uniref:Uncharacterized protein n=1 Tax=Pandoravirus celtis TaxID=2568002 RepID=A0A4D6EHR4_9VIRU|nr:hypothetical protein pclt_cds_670 [Pandoravirus celtis]
MCDLLLLADTFAGLVARTLSKIAESATVEVVYGRSLSSSPSPHPSEHPAVRVSVRVSLAWRPLACLAWTSSVSRVAAFGRNPSSSNTQSMPMCRRYKNHRHCCRRGVTLDHRTALDRTVTSAHNTARHTGTSRDAPVGRQHPCPLAASPCFALWVSTRSRSSYPSPTLIRHMSPIASRNWSSCHASIRSAHCDQSLPICHDYAQCGGRRHPQHSTPMASRLAARMCASRTIIYMAHTRCDRVRQYFPPP